MPRPCKRRRVCAKPRCNHFGPISLEDKKLEVIYMTVDEFETIRLIDLEGVTQEQCATQMEIARTTAQAIYSIARKKLAECLVYGKQLIIEGGNYVFCDGTAFVKGCKKKCYHMSKQEIEDTQIRKGEWIMKIAVTYEDGKVFAHFGHTEFFKLYEVEENKVINSKVISTNGSGHGALAHVLKNHQVDVLICGGIGGGAKNALAEAGIKLYGGVKGEADEAVEAFLNNTLNYDANVKCNHHGDHHHGSEGGSCGSHGCGNH